jgi:hypothetical protein
MTVVMEPDDCSMFSIITKQFHNLSHLGRRLTIPSKYKRESSHLQPFVIKHFHFAIIVRSVLSEVFL